MLSWIDQCTWVNTSAVLFKLSYIVMDFVKLHFLRGCFYRFSSCQYILQKSQGFLYPFLGIIWFWIVSSCLFAVVGLLKWVTQDCTLQESESRLWSYVYPNKYSEQQKAEEERWKEAERERKFKDEGSSRIRSKEIAVKEESKDNMCLESRSTSMEECRSVGKDPRSGLHIPVSSSMVQHPSYMPYVHGYPYGKPYEAPHPGFRGVTPVMMQNYPGKLIGSFITSGIGENHHRNTSLKSRIRDHSIITYPNSSARFVVLFDNVQVNGRWKLFHELMRLNEKTI